MCEESWSPARAFPRALLLIAWTLSVFAARMAGYPCRLVSKRVDRAWRRATLRWWGRGAARLLRVRLDVRGPMPRAPFLLVANHLSTLDSIVLAGLLGSPFVAMERIATWPFIGFMVRMMGSVFIDRKRPRDALRVNGLIRDLLAEGEGVVVFAEADTSDGSGVKPFHPALLEPAAAAARPVHHATIHHRTPDGAPPAAHAVCWVGETPLPTHLKRMLSLPWVETTVVFGSVPIAAADRKVLAEELHRAVERQLALLRADRDNGLGPAATAGLGV